jgi:hypothetical protein
MSTRSFGMVGKSYNTASEAFKDANYANPIEIPTKAEYDYVWAVLGGLTAIVVFVAVAIRW